MPRRLAWIPAVVLALTAVGPLPLGPSQALAQPAKSGPKAKTAPAASTPTDDGTGRTLEFLAGLRQRGYYDLAIDYIESLRKAPDTPADLRAILDYEEGRGMLEEAATTADLERRKDQLEQARRKLDAFTKANTNHPKASEALVQLARLLVERGHLSVLQSGEAKEKAEVDAKLVQARDSFAAARTAYDKALARLKALHESYPKFLEMKDPRYRLRESAHAALMDATLQRALVDYEDAHTYPMGSPNRAQLLDKALPLFEETYRRYRQQMAGLYAHMWVGKCYEEKGNLGEAMGVYNELMEHENPELRPLQRQVGYFRILVLAKRGEFALAADEADRWLKDNPNAQRSEEGLGVRLELAKNILAQLPKANENEKPAAIKVATDHLAQVVRYYSPHKAEALKLLQQYRPKTAARALDVARLTYEDAMTQADEAISSEQFPRAIELLKLAVLKADVDKQPEKANRARYIMAYCCFQSGRYYESAILCEHLARRYPRLGLSPQAIEIGLAAYTAAYNTYPGDREGDLARLVDLAKYTAATWPDSPQADASRITVGDVALGQGHYEDAAKVYEEVRANSPRKVDAQAKGGVARWRLSRNLREKDQASLADAEAKTALELLETAYKARMDARAALTDPALIDNACDLADVLIASSQAPRAVQILEPLANSLNGKANGPLASRYVRVMSTLLQAHVAANQVDKAVADMRTLEQNSAGASLTSLYFMLGKSLEKELESLKARGDGGGFARTQQAYQKFLQALLESKSGQTYDSLQWAGESLLSIGLYSDAAAVFQKVFDTYDKDEKFKSQLGAYARLARTRLKWVAALRGQKRFNEALQTVDKLVSENRNSLDALMERCQVLEDRALAGSGSLEEARKEWMKLAQKLGFAKPKPIEYYESWYHIANLYAKAGDKARALQTLKNIMTLSPAVGNDEMRRRYEALKTQLGGK